MELLPTILGGVGIPIGVVGAAWGVYVTWSHAHPKIAIDMKPGYQLSPSSLGLGAHLQITYDGRSVGDLYVFLLKICNRGSRDFTEEIKPSTRRAGVIFPHIRFQGFRIVGYHTVKNVPEDFYIAFSKTGVDTLLWLNIQKIRKGKCAEFQIVCVPDPSSSEQETRAILNCGYVPDLRIAVSGMLEKEEQK